MPRVTESGKTVYEWPEQPPPPGEPRIAFDRDALRRLCDQWKIVRFEFFGSVLRDDFHPESDVDCLVTFAEGARVDLFDLAGVTLDLEALFGRRVDVLTRREVERSTNPFWQQAVFAGSRDVL